ncbi:MAG: sulfotransferase [Gammaproteobacteria bacterium]|nr:sulfotransferase [Gammaproteobacteria bacterium]
MTTKRINFAIIAPARSGSTMLIHALNSHPAICCHSEVFGRYRVSGFSPKARQAVLPESDNMEKEAYWDFLLRLREQCHPAFLRDCIYSAKIAKRAVGFKILYTQFLDLHFADLAASLSEDMDIKIVYLRRRNMFRRHLSEQIFMDRRLKEGSAEPAPGTTRVNIDLDRFVQDVRNHEAALRRIQAALEGHKNMTVFYEDLVHNKAQTVSALLAYLAVTPRDLVFRTEKVSSDDLESMITNLSEVRNRVKDPKYAPYLAEIDLS